MTRFLSLLALLALVLVGSDAATAQAPRIDTRTVDARTLDIRPPTIDFERFRPAVRTPPVVGTWDSTYGPLTIVQREDGRFIGNYSSYGRINGRMNGDGKMTGTFYHPVDNGTCSTTRQGSTNWGHFEFTFAPDYSSFKGKWNWCGGDLTQDWNAAKM